MSWKEEAKRFLIQHVERNRIESLLNRIMGIEADYALSDLSTIVDHILGHMSNPSDLLDRKEILVSSMRFDSLKFTLSLYTLI
jgi:hypothetical protein